MTNTGKVVSVLLMAALLGGCSTPEGGSLNTSGVDAETAVGHTQETYRSWRDKVVKAEPLMIYAPNKYASMMESWQRADVLYKDMVATPATAQKSYSLFSSGTYLDRFYAEIAVIEANYNELVGLKDVADEVLEPAITQMAYLNSIDANAHYRSEFVRLNRFYAKLFSLIESGEFSEAREEQQEFLARAHSLEVRVIKRIYIAPEEEALRQLWRDDVRYYAPLSFARVEQEIDTAKALIDKSPRAFDAINQSVSAIKFELAHAENTANEVKALRELNRDEYEGYILGIEDKLLAISSAANGSDLRDLPLSEQVRLIEAGIVKIRQREGEHPLPKRDELNSDQLVKLQLILQQQNTEIMQLKQQLNRLNGTIPEEQPAPSEPTLQTKATASLAH
ncbi:hypothetical protein ABT56_13560 [Photobacterium aquae]|uniref:ATPase n=1 Tax=Photobacterium aquae TaxID=1195763 RepID=A0A0J1GYP2_9GAMM|nr:hypothetical protein [Photobacterium aquae]KLV04748.1 hypothetical protein ABT56_13560 [Photobacterium aquae]